MFAPLVGKSRTRLLLALVGLVVLVAAIPVVIELQSQNQDLRQQATGGSCQEECPSARDRGLLKNCHPPDRNGDAQDSRCNVAGRIESCGNRSYCCPVANGDWTTVMTGCRPSPSPTPSPTLTPQPSITPTPSVAFFKQDINKDGTVNQLDLNILLANYDRSVGATSADALTDSNTELANPRADVNSDGKVNALDYASVMDFFGRSIYVTCGGTRNVPCPDGYVCRMPDSQPPDDRVGTCVPRYNIR